MSTILVASFKPGDGDKHDLSLALSSKPASNEEELRAARSSLSGKNKEIRYFHDTGEPIPDYLDAVAAVGGNWMSYMLDTQ